MNLRFSLLGLIALTTFAGLASAALVQPSVGWTSVVVSLTAAKICWQVLRAILTAGESRAAALGWLLFAVGYLAITLGPWLSSHLGPQLLTSRGLIYAQAQWHKVLVGPSDGQAQLWYDVNGRANINGPFFDGTGSTLFVDSGWVSYPAMAGTVDVATIAHHFHLSGHWLFAWIAGWFGGLIAVQFQRYQTTRLAVIPS